MKTLDFLIENWFSIIFKKKVICTHCQSNQYKNFLLMLPGMEEDILPPTEFTWEVIFNNFIIF